MEHLTLFLRDLNQLSEIRLRLKDGVKLTKDQKKILVLHLEQLPLASKLFEQKVPMDLPYFVHVKSLEEVMPAINKWMSLFEKLPESRVYWGLDHELGKRGVLFCCYFAPSLAHAKQERSLRLDLKVDRNAEFYLYEIEEIKNYPDLYQFKGTWKEGYLLAVETCKKGWPQVEFPKELENFLPQGFHK